MPGKIVLSDNHSEYLFSRTELANMPWIIFIKINKLIPNKVTFIETGISIQLPVGCGGFILPRSGLASKYSITSINSPGLIDPGYTGEIKVPLINHSDETYYLKNNERFAQLVLINVNSVNFKIVDKLDESMRSDKGFGSTG